MKRPDLTQRNADIVRREKRGESLVAIGKALGGISRERVRQILDEHGVKNAKRRFAEREKRLLKRLSTWFAKHPHAPAYEAAPALKITPAQVYRLKGILGVERTVRRKEGSRAKLTKAYLTREYVVGRKNQTEIAQATGYSQATVFDRLKEYGLHEARRAGFQSQYRAAQDHGIPRSHPGEARHAAQAST